MSAARKIENLRNLWFGYALIAVVVEAIGRGLEAGVLWDAVVTLAVMVGVTWYVAGRVQAKSSIAWAFWVVGAVLGVVLAGLELLAVFGGGGHFEVFVCARLGIAIWLHLRTLGTLRAPDVKRFVMI